MTTQSPSLPRPTATEISQAVDAIQNQFEAQFAEAYKVVNRRRAMAFWEAGWAACEKALREKSA